MLFCRSARLTLFPVARKSLAGFCRNVVPRRPMSSGVPGGSGENFVYFALCGVSLTAGLAYAYRTVSEDRTRYNDRVTELQARPKDEWQPKPWPAKGGDNDAESEEEEAGGDGEETPAEEAVAVEAPLEAEDGAEVVEAEPAVVEAEPVSVETVNEPSGADLETELAEAMEEALGAPASTESDALTPASLSDIITVSEREAAESVGMPVSCVGEAAERLADVASEIMEEAAEELKQNQLGTATGPDANHKDLMETQAVMGVVSERESVVLVDDTPTASTGAGEEKSGEVQLVPEAKEASTESVAEMSLVEEMASAAATEEESVVGEPVSSEEPATDTTAEGSEVNVEKEAADTTEVKESTAATVEDPDVFISNVEPESNSKEEPAPDSTAEEPFPTVEEEAGDATEAKDSAATIVEEPEVYSSAEEPESTSVEGPAPDSTVEGSEVSVDYEMVDTSEAKESIVIVTEEPVVFTYKVEPISTSKEEPAPRSSAEGPAAALEEEAGDATEAKGSAAAVVEGLEMFSSTEAALFSEEEEPAPDSTAEGPVASLEEEPAEAPTESITLNEVKTETLDSSIHPPEKIPEDTPAAASPDNQIESKDVFSQVVEAEISPDVEVQSTLEAMKIEANPITEAAETEDEDRPAVPAEMCPVMENSEPVLSTTVLAEEVAQKATEKVQAQLMGTETAEPKRTPAKEYIVVVLEGAPKELKKPKILAIAPMTASVPSPKVKDP